MMVRPGAIGKASHASGRCTAGRGAVTSDPCPGNPNPVGRTIRASQPSLVFRSGDHACPAGSRRSDRPSRGAPDIRGPVPRRSRVRRQVRRPVQSDCSARARQQDRGDRRRRGTCESCGDDHRRRRPHTDAGPHRRPRAHHVRDHSPARGADGRHRLRQRRGCGSPSRPACAASITANCSTTPRQS